MKIYGLGILIAIAGLSTWSVVQAAHGEGHTNDDERENRHRGWVFDWAVNATNTFSLGDWPAYQQASADLVYEIKNTHGDNHDRHIELIDDAISSSLAAFPRDEDQHVGAVPLVTRLLCSAKRGLNQRRLQQTLVMRRRSNDNDHARGPLNEAGQQS